MLKKILITQVFIIVIVFLLSIIKIDSYNNYKQIISTSKIINNSNGNIKLEEENKEDKIIGRIIIDKLNINKELYDINSKLNNIENNITILHNSIPPTKDNSILFIAAHSGDGPIAFFKDLDKLNENDKIIIIYNSNKYVYIVKNIWEEEKNGFIHVSKSNEKQLVLTTCSPTKDNYQLIVNCILKS